MGTRNGAVIDRLLRTAAELPIENGRGHSSRMAAAVVRGRRVVAIGTNQRKTHPLQRRFGRNPHSEQMHAEIHAIAQAIALEGEESLRGATVYVARTKRLVANGTADVPAMAMPCSGCRRAMRRFGVRRAIFTTESGYGELDLTF